MNCEELLDYLSDYIDHNLSDELSAAAQEHLRTCRNCSVVLDSTQKMILLYRAQNRQQRIPPARGQALYDQIARVFAQRPPNPPDEEEDNL
jgi:predicted anti-sigma-YlaC factor YlaD